MTQPSFLARKTFGWPNYFWIALGFTLVVAMVPRATQEALRSNTNRAEDWLPATYVESKELRWFREHFLGEGYVLVTWEGATLGDSEKLNLLYQKLSERRIEVDPGRTDVLEPPVERTGDWFRRILTGPSVIDELTSAPLSLSYPEAVRRLEGSLVGPPQLDAEGQPLGDGSRITVLVTFLSPEGYSDNRTMREVVNYIADVAVEECGVPRDDLRMGGPVVDNVAIDQAGEASLARLMVLSGVVGLLISFWCFRHLGLTAVVVAVGSIAALMSMAIVFYAGVIEVLIFGPPPLYGAMDAVLMSMPALVYVLGLSGAIHLVNYYRDARLKFGLEGAAERAVRIAWIPCSLAALTTAVGLGSLATSDIMPIKKFGGFTAVAVLAAIGVLFTLLPVFLHRFPPRRIGRKPWEKMTSNDAGLPQWANRCSRWLTWHHTPIMIGMVGAMIFIGMGTLKLESSIRLLKLLDEESRLVQDYIWVEHNVGYLVPMEVVLTVPPEKRRSGDEHAEMDGQQYRMTMFERMEMVRRVLSRMEDLDEVSRTLSAATFAPTVAQDATGAARRGEEFTTNINLEENRDAFRDYLQLELVEHGRPAEEGRELWRISARVTALQDIDYGRFTGELRAQVEPVLLTYRQRDRLVRELHQVGRRIEGSQICILFRGELEENLPAENQPEQLLGELLRESWVEARVEGRRGNLSFYNLAHFDRPDVPQEEREQVLGFLRQQDAVLFVSEELEAAAEPLVDAGANLVDLSERSTDVESAAIAYAPEVGPRPIRSVYTGIIPLVFKTQRQLLVSLGYSILWASVLIAIVLAIVFRSALAGIVAMVPNLFPVSVVFGTLGWLGVNIDIGIMMTASVALGVAVDNTVHLVTWFRHAQNLGLDRRAATLMAYERCATAMVQTAFVGGLGLVVFAASTFTPTQQFGYLMITILMAALVGDLILLPALLSSPLGKLFERRATHDQSKAKLDPALALIAGSVDGDEQERPGDSAKQRQLVADKADSKPNGGDDTQSPDDEDGEGGKRSSGTQQTGKATDGQPLISPSHIALRDKLRSFRRS